ncbi:hypothetical protein [Flagellimonas oceanensis]|uniref:hypothetical protein n=1 Tax=Flagellimonas oceanensis TaxID=2499163 RepID=UPI003BAC4699
MNDQVIKQASKYILGIFILIFVLTSCTNNHVIKFYTLDKENCVTVITKNDLRYVIAGDSKNIPHTNFVKLDISKIPELGDGIWISWLDNDGWEIVVDKSIIVENKLDSRKYIFKTKLPTDDRGIPTEIKFRKDNGAIFSYYLMKLSPDKGAIVEMK